MDSHTHLVSPSTPVGSEWLAKLWVTFEGLVYDVGGRTLRGGTVRPSDTFEKGAFLRFLDHVTVSKPKS